MRNAEKTLMRYSGRGIAVLMRRVLRTSDVICDPADLHARLAEMHPVILAFWHGQFMMLPTMHTGGHKVSAMVARHGDAEMIAEALRPFQIGLIRGAGAGGRKKDRGGAAAARAAVRALRDNTTVAMTADVPPGPARVAGMGTIAIAKASGCPIVPFAAATKRFTSFDTWSRMTMNLPYTTLAFTTGEPIFVPDTADEDKLAELRQHLENEINAAMARAYQLAGADISRATPLDKLAALSPPTPTSALKIYSHGLALLRPAVPFLLRARERRGKEDPARRGERLGFAGRERFPGPLIWVHAASVGETNAVLPLINEMLSLHPAAHLLLTTGTTTSAEIAAQRLPQRACHQYVPLDVPQYVERFLDHWRPDLAIFTESDIWPNLVIATSARAIPLALVNARMSPRSSQRWRKFRRHGRVLFSRFNVVLAQSTSVARVIKLLGAPNVIVTGNLKIDAPPPPINESVLIRLKEAVAGRPILLAASTHPQEEAAVAAAHVLIARQLPGLLSIIVPRHPERGAGLFAQLSAQGLKISRRSVSDTPAAGTDIYLADTLGELGTFYSLCPVAFIGGSLIEHGGQNPIEAVRLGAVILTGPHYHNFSEPYEALIAKGGAAVVQNAAELADKALRLLSDGGETERMRAGASVALADLGGALTKTVEVLSPYLGKQRT